MPSIPTFTDILMTAEQLADAASCLPSAQAVRLRRGARAGLTLEERRLARTSLRNARASLTEAAAHYRAFCPQPEEGLAREAERLCGLMSAASTVSRRRNPADASGITAQELLRRLTDLSERLTALIADCPTLADWAHPDVMVGSLRAQEQYRINLEKNFYYAPVRVVPPSALPVKYIALCRSASSEEPGIRVYGEVKTIRTIRRSRIPVPGAAANGNDLYYIFPVREWTTLPAPIGIREETVYAPRFTNLFLLTHSRATYELFDVTSEAAYRLNAAATGFAAGEEDAPVRITDSLTLSLTDGCLVLSDTRAVTLARLPLAEFRAAPGRCLRSLLAAGRLG